MFMVPLRSERQEAIDVSASCPLLAAKPGGRGCGLKLSVQANSRQLEEGSEFRCGLELRDWVEYLECARERI